MIILLESVVETLSFLMVVTALITAPLVLYVTAPYGKFSVTGGTRWGPLLPAKFAWFLMESPNLWMFFCYKYIPYVDNTSININFANLPYTNKILLSLFWLHYIHRTLIFPFNIYNSTPMPLSVCLLAFCYCCWNSFIQVGSLLTLEYNFEYSQSPIFLFGLSLFFVGMFINIYSDTLLINSRKNSREKYIIPRGFLFEYISCPNYFGEIIEWFGFSIACQFSLPALAFALFTLANIGPRAIRQHAWYKKKFENYPNRKALIPFVV